MRIAVLGPLEVDGGRTQLAPRDQVVLEALAVRAGETVRAEALAEALWGEHLPPSWPKVVQGCVSRLRKALGSAAIMTSSTGYRLVLHRDDFDHLCFEDLLLRARELLATGEPERARYASGQALGLWRGDPLERLTEWETGRIESERLGERRRDAEDLYAESAIRTGRHADILGELQRMVAQQPTRERRWGLLALAQYHSGRQAEALGTLQRARATLVNEFGLDPGPQLAELEKAILRQDPALVAEGAAPVTVGVCPYLGLVAYDVGDAPAFFGREADVTACLRRLDEAGILAVVGPSGCGKSSLVRAGVAAALVRDGHRVQILTPGAHPEEVLAQIPVGKGAVLVVDQCEEALALDEASPEREAFFAGLVDFAGHDQLVLSLRADRLGELAAHPEFAHLAEKGLYLLGAMGPAELRSAIEGPAAQAALRLEPGLVDLLVREVEGSPGALPLLSHVLRQTWRRREGDTLTVQGYAATGGVREAVAQSAERLYRELTATQQSMLRDLMVRLVSSDDTGEPVRTRVARRSVASDDEHSAVVERLVGARLLSSDGDTVEIAHESLAVAWPRLRSWLDDDVDGLRIMRHLTVAAESWYGLGRPDSELYRGVRQARAAEWHARTDATLTDTERDFLHDSTALAEKEQRATEAQVRRERRSNQRLRAGLAAVAALLAVAIVTGALAKTAADRADQQALVADARRLGAEALRAPDLDRSLLLAAAGVKLDDSVDTRSNLLAALDRAPQLVRTVRTETLWNLTVNNATGQVALAMPGRGLTLHDRVNLQEAHRAPGVLGTEIVATPDGRTYVASHKAEMTGGPADPPAAQLFDRTGAVAPTQLGGIPAKRFVQIGGLSLSGDGRWLAVGLVHSEAFENVVVGVWDLQAPQHPISVVDVGDQPRSPVVSNDGHTLYTLGNGHLRVADLPSGAERRLLSAGDLGAREIGESLTISPDGRTLAVNAGPDVLLLDTRRLAPRAVLRGGESPEDLVFSRDGRRLAAAGTNLMAWEISGHQPVELLRQEGGAGSWVAFSPDARTLYSAEQGGLLLAWDLARDRGLTRMGPGGLPARDGAPVMRFSPDRHKLAYVWGFPPAFQVRDVATGTLGPLVEIDLRQRNWVDIAWSPDGTRLNVTTGDSEVGIWDAVTGRKLASHTLVQPAGSTRTGEAAEGASIAFWSLDGTYLLVGTTTGRLHVLDGRTLQPRGNPVQVTTAKGGKPPPIAGLEPRHDLRTVLTYADRTQVVDYLEGIVRAPLDFGGEGPQVHYAPLGDGALVHTTDGQVGLRDARTQQWISPPATVPPFPGYMVGWSPDGTRVATVSEGKVGWWDGGAFQGSVSVPDAMSVAFSDDGRRLFVAGSASSVRTWDLDAATWVDAACRVAGRNLTEAEWRNFLPDRPTVPVCTS